MAGDVVIRVQSLKLQSPMRWQNLQPVLARKKTTTTKLQIFPATLAVDVVVTASNKEVGKSRIKSEKSEEEDFH